MAKKIEGPWQAMVLLQQDGDDGKGTAGKCNVSFPFQNNPSIADLH